MRIMVRSLFVILAFGLGVVSAVAQCPKRPFPGSFVHNPLALHATNGVLQAELTMKRSVDEGGYTHYCYNYQTPDGTVEAPTLRLNPGDTLELDVKNRIQLDDADTMAKMSHMSSEANKVCGDTGVMTEASTNVHYHGLNVPPKCHGDEVINTLIQPGSKAFHYKIEIPTTEPPGLYWYHPHTHGFTEFQVNGGAAGALVVEGMEKVRPEVAGLKERILILRQQFLVPWIPGPYQLTLNYQVSNYPQFRAPRIRMKPNEKQFWRVANATNQDFMPLQVWFDGKPQQLQVIALDGYPLPAPRFQQTVLLPPASRAEFIVQAPPDGVAASLITKEYDTGPTGNPDLAQKLADIDTSGGADPEEPEIKATPEAQTAMAQIRFRGLESLKPTAERKLFFSEEFGGTNGPIQFYITVEGQKQKVFEPDEKPAIVTDVRAVEDWTIENRALETHAFHIHQVHFLVLEIDGKPANHQDLRDTIEIPFWEGKGHPFHKVKLRMDFRDPTIAGTSVFHCHILLHEDLGMMHKIQINP